MDSFVDDDGYLLLRPQRGSTVWARGRSVPAMTTADRQDVDGVVCPDCGSGVFRQYDVTVDSEPGSMPAPGLYGCHNGDCGWQSPDKPVAPGHLSWE